LLLPSLPEPPFKLGGTSLRLHACFNLHVVMGAGVAAEIQNAA